MPNEKNISDQMSNDLDGDILSDAEHDEEKESAWDDEVVKDDVFTKRDDEAPTKEIYTMSIPNQEQIKGVNNPGYKKLCLDKDLSFPPAESISCVVLARIRPNIESVPYNESKGLKPYDKTIGYSFDGMRPTPDKKGGYMSMCINPNTKVPYCMCSQKTPFEGGKPVKTQLSTQEGVITNKEFLYLGKGKKINVAGECPRGRWGNTLTDDDRQTFNITSVNKKPDCDNHIIFYCWHLIHQILFVAYFKRSSHAGALNFLGTFSKQIGDEKIKIPLAKYEALITLKNEGNYTIAAITNTRKEANYAKIKPILNWFEERRDRFIRNLAITLQIQREQDMKNMDFPGDD